ncbi:relaxase/mobilization nuclease domain-containing protein [Bacillus wiedmannii]|uniref:relaxase/mobilization nuclease domain-containing protein n=1 Tax=Bacillus wiedmannii TaxID=1890302 RepID=UPI000BF16298|nr:relaxase/mobilization nuclease domain-containing protein [Bacillus wiedmannii]PEJ66372.1 protein rlx [Bacillus wiedmannii]
MATTKLGNTKSASQTINYAEKRAVEKSGLNCDIDYAKSNFKELRMLYGKDNGIQAHTIIQSFKPGEVTPEEANAIGLELACSVAKDYQVAIYTHTDTEHIHNHIVINSVNIENGKKYHSNNEQRDFIKSENDRICQERGLSVVVEKQALVRYTAAEKSLLKQGKTSWKDEIRQAVDMGKTRTSDIKGLTAFLDDLGIKTRLRGETLSYKHPESLKWVRGSKLGYDYEMGGIEHGFKRRIRESQTRGQSIVGNEYKRTNQLSSENVRDRTSERIDSAAYRPISRKYREEQQARERANTLRQQNEQEKQRELEQQSRAIERSGPSLER